MENKKRVLKFGMIGFFALLGVVTFTMFMHEGIHILQAKEPLAVCFNMVDAATYGKDFNALFLKEQNVEVEAYLGSTFVLIALGITMYVSLFSLMKGEKNK